MSSLKQYIDLAAAHRAAFDAGSPAALNTARAEAFARLSAHGARLPEKGDEGYEKTSVEEMFAPDYGLNINRLDIPVDLAASLNCGGVPHTSTLLAVTANDVFHPTATLAERLPEGVAFCSMREAATRFPDILAQYYATTAKGATSDLNTLLAQDGVFIHVSDNVHAAKPLQLVNIFSSPSGEPLMGVRRVLIVAGRNASLQLLVCDHTQDETTRYLSSEVTEIFALEGAKVEYVNVEESSALSSRMSDLHIVQEARSEVRVNYATLTCGTTRNNLTVDLRGEHASCQLCGMAVASKTMHIDNDTNVRHLTANCHSNQLFRYVVDDHAVGAFEGSILVADGARFTEAYQSNKNIVAAPTATMHTKPQLEIYNDDVKCSHGASTGQLDRNALFYMATRGIPENEARTMLMQAFMVDVINEITIEGLAERMRHLTELRFSEDPAQLCATCRQTPS
ncbi:MAG: Fe-S cluster assembly protein SufD [Muribaculaceae bacterium]|nr:Fe-S cluster assembly protein SufD [Muribaculaceae bacterium]